MTVLLYTLLFLVSVAVTLGACTLFTNDSRLLAETLTVFACNSPSGGC
jgi:hypothetical protein